MRTGLAPALAAIGCAWTFAGCGPATTVFEASGPFASGAVASFELGAASDHDVLDLLLTDGPRLTLQFARSDPSVTCWRSAGNQHVCTLPGRAGLLLRGTLQTGAASCAVEGWAERLGDAWQLDLAIAPLDPCDPGVWRVTIEP